MRRIFKENKMCENFAASVSRVLRDLDRLKGQKVDTVKRLEPPMVNTRPFTVVVEGNIDSGKTTFLEHFKQDLSLKCSAWKGFVLVPSL